MTNTKLPELLADAYHWVCYAGDIVSPDSYLYPGLKQLAVNIGAALAHKGNG